MADRRDRPTPTTAAREGRQERCYPVSLMVAGRRCVVIGGGRVAERKVRDLLTAGARVTVTALEATEGLERLAQTEDIDLRRRAPVEADLDGAFVAIAATDDEELNAWTAACCEARGTLVNVVDRPELCSFYVPATVRRGPVSVAISTGGASPALARRLREEIEALVGEEYGLLAELLGELRDGVKQRWATPGERADVWRRIINSEVLELLRAGESDEARRLAERLAEADV